MERLSLSNSAFEGNNNAYLFADGAETVLIDTGDRTDRTRAQLDSGLAEHGVTFADVDLILLTHWHGDHAGLAGTIQAESDATVYVHARDAPLVEGDEDAWAEMHAIQERYFDEWGMPESKRSALREVLADFKSMGEPADVIHIEDGDRISFDEYELTVRHVSGHAAGLCIYEFERDGRREVFTGDAVLPVYTPNVGGADVRVDGALAKYLRGLRRIVEADYDRAWPGHRNPIDDPAGRARTIHRHHEDRTLRVLDVLGRRGPSDAWTVSAELFGELESIHILHGPGEAFAHLEHLEHSGGVVREGDEYRLVDDVAAELRANEDRETILNVSGYAEFDT